jgi:hypothetical protein
MKSSTLRPPRHHLAAALLTGALAATSAGAGDGAQVRQRTELKAEHYSDAASIVTLDAHSRVEILSREGGWVRVQAGDKQGWLRGEALTDGSAPASAATNASTNAASRLLALDNGRAGRGELLATTGIRGFARPASPRIHALILTIGAYRNGIPQLSGVAVDAENGRAIARRMGVPDGNIHALRDEQLTLDGMRRAFDELDAALADNDEVFIYYSGHGGRQKVVERDGSERCAESLITVDGEGFIDSELEARLKKLSARASKVVVFLDACHSGGVTTRALAADAAFTPKYWHPKDAGGDACSTPVNVLTRGIAQTPARPGNGAANFAYIAAARDNEISLDQPGRGGVASQSWLACMAGSAQDSDGSGGLSAEEIRNCAQQQIDTRLQNVRGYLPHHVAITGNADMVLSYAVKAPEPSAAPTPPVAVPGATPATPKPSPLATLQDIYNSRDDRRLVTARTERPQARIGQDKVEFSVTSREGGYLYLLMVGSDGKAFDLLFPNSLDRDNLIRPGETLHLPRSRWQLDAQGPAGTDTLLAIVADAPKDFSKAGLKPAGPFSSVDAAQAKDIQLVTAGSSPRDECTDTGPTRNLAVQQRCSTSYGAALLSIEEVAR